MHRYTLHQAERGSSLSLSIFLFAFLVEIFDKVENLRKITLELSRVSLSVLGHSK